MTQPYMYRMMVERTTVITLATSVATLASCTYAGCAAAAAGGRADPEREPERRLLTTIAAAGAAAAPAAQRAAAPVAISAVRPADAALAAPRESRGTATSATPAPRPKVPVVVESSFKPTQLRQAARKQKGNPKKRKQGRAAQRRATVAQRRAEVAAAVAVAAANVQQPLSEPLDSVSRRAQAKKERVERKVARANKKLAKDLVAKVFAAVLASTHEDKCGGLAQGSALVAQETTELTPSTPRPELESLKSPSRVRALAAALDARERAFSELVAPPKQLQSLRRPAASPRRLHQTSEPELEPEIEAQKAVLAGMARLSPVFSEETSPRSDEEERKTDGVDARLKAFDVRLDQEPSVSSRYGLISIGSQPANDGAERLVLRAGRAMGIGPSDVLTVWFDSSMVARRSVDGGKEGNGCYDALCEPIFPRDQDKLYMLGE